jgi:DNA-directed RNA polymerase specialized sigma24 family protein
MQQNRSLSSLLSLNHAASMALRSRMNVYEHLSWHDVRSQPFATCWPLILDTGCRPAVRLTGLATGNAPIAARPVAQRTGVALLVDREGKSLVDACVAGDPAARRRFHAEFLPLIYRFEGGGGENETSGHDFLTFVLEGDRLYRRLQSFRGAAPLRTYLWSCILPDLLKQFRTMIRRRRLDTVSLDEHANDFVAGAAARLNHSDCEVPDGAASLLEQLPLDKRVLFKLLYIEDFDIEAAEIQRLAERTGRSVREVLDRIEAAREVVRSREAVQRTRLDAAESAGQWIRLYERRLAQIEEDLVASDANSPRGLRLEAQRSELLQKLDKRRRQQSERLRAGSHTVVTLPTEMLADLLGQPASSTRSQITRVRQELAALLSGAGGKNTAVEAAPGHRTNHNSDADAAGPSFESKGRGESR